MENDHTKKILFTIGNLETGGAESQMLLLIRGLVSRGYQCELAALNASGPLRAQLDKQGVAVHDLGYRLNSPRLLRLAQLCWALPRLWWIALRYKPDIVQAYLPLTNFIAALAGRLAGVKLIITCRRGLGTHQDRHPFWGPIDRITNRLSTIVTVNSEAVGLDTIERDSIAKDKLVLIYNGLDFAAYDRLAQNPGMIRKELGLDADTIGILSVGNLIPYKGYADLIHAIVRLLPSERLVRFFIAGRDDGIGANLKSLVGELNIGEGIVVFLGPRKDIPRLMAAMDMFVMPSHEEGFSNALLEAMAAGRPIVATAVGGNPEALMHGRYGSLVPPHNPVELADALGRTIASLDQERLKSGEAAEDCRRRYAADAMVESYVALYN